MSDMLSQAEIDALLGGGSNADSADPEPSVPEESFPDVNGMLSTENKDILGEIGNISMGTAATTLFALLGQKVWITTPRVNVRTWGEIATSYDRPCVGIKVAYTEGLKGSNILILNQKDVKIICNLMMGGDGTAETEGELNELDLSAIGEAMNQMVGSSSTSLSSMIKQKIDIDTPHAFVLDFNDDNFMDEQGFTRDEIVVSISFRMEIGTLIDSEIMQILPFEFASSMVDNLKTDLFASSESVSPPTTAVQPDAQQIAATPPAQSPPPAYQTSPQSQQSAYQAPPQSQPPMYQAPPQGQPPMYQAPQYPDGAYQNQPPPQMPQYQAPPMYQMPQQGYYAPPQEMSPYYQQPQQQQMLPPQQNINVQSAQFQNFDAGSVMQQKENIDIIMDVPLEVTVELGRATKKIKEILEFSVGTIIELDKLAGEPIDIMVNGKFVAKGEVVVIDENFGIRITDIISVDKRI